MNAIMDVVCENRVLSCWAALFDRNPDQLNEIHEADAELIALGGDRLLAVTVDTIAEEIALGFYRHPETIGWMGATACLSDLAAVAAAPIGLVVSVALPKRGDAAFQEGVARGLTAACRAAGTFVLGGDTNYAERPSVTGCAVGLVARQTALRRTGCQPGELVYATGLLGAGAAAAGRAVLRLSDDLYAEDDFRPHPRLAEARMAAPFATAAMDTSDGLVATLDQLARLNGVGFAIDAASPLDLLEPGAKRLCTTLGVPALVMLAAHHGEFELVFTVPTSRQEPFEKAAADGGFSPRLLGRTTDVPGLSFGAMAVDGARIRNLAEDLGGEPQQYLSELLRLAG